MFWRTTHWLEYLKNSKIGVEFTDHSFYFKDEFVPLLQEGQELFSPGFADRKEILHKISEIAKENNVKRIQVNSDIKEYLNISGCTCVLSLDEINPTKGHKSSIKKAQKYLTYETTLDINQFMQDYFRIAGKKTRPEITFYLLLDFIIMGYGTLLKATFQDKTAGYVYLLHYNDWAYYFMSCVEIEFREYNVSHYLQSVAFDILRQKGVKRYELGNQVYLSLHCQPTAKERNISLFKRGFGGEIVSSPASEFYFDKNYMREVFNDRINNYIKEREKND
jgi:hypothetical protein